MMSIVINERSDSWPLQDAKTRFSELVREAQSSGPQHVTVHGREAVVVLSEETYRLLKGQRSGQMLVDTLRNSPLQDIELEHGSVTGLVRDVELLSRWFHSSP